MAEIESYLQAALQKDTKLRKLIENTLNNGPASDNDEDEIKKKNLPFLPPMSFDQDLVGSSSTNHSPAEMNQSMALDNVSSFEPNVSENDPELTYYLGESNQFERDCVSAHVKRLKRELQESANRKRERREQPKQRQFTGKPIAASNIISKKPKRVHSRQRKKPSGAGKSGIA